MPKHIQHLACDVGAVHAPARRRPSAIMVAMVRSDSSSCRAASLTDTAKIAAKKEIVLDPRRLRRITVDKFKYSDLNSYFFEDAAE